MLLRSACGVFLKIVHKLEVVSFPPDLAVVTGFGRKITEVKGNLYDIFSRVHSFMSCDC